MKWKRAELKQTRRRKNREQQRRNISNFHIKQEKNLEKEKKGKVQLTARLKDVR
jgi:hypothetical protein